MLHQNKENFNEIIPILLEKLSGRDKRIAIANIATHFKGIKYNKLAAICKISIPTVRKAIAEYKKGEFIDRFYDRGRTPITIKLPRLKDDIIHIANSQTQTDPTFKSTRLYTRLTVSTIREELIKLGYLDYELPTNETLRKLVNSLGFTLRKVRKTKPLKKIIETDLIFNNLKELHNQVCLQNNTVRISIDAKDKVKIGDFSRGGYSRVLATSLDHDFSSKYITPFGILDTKTSKVDITFTESKVTADFIVDTIEKYWLDNYYNTTKDTLVINMDNGPENNSRRSQFLKRIADFSVNYNIKVILAYYPPYHSKYNPIERIWGVLERHWNGNVLDSKETVLRFAQSMTYKGIKPTVTLAKEVYNCGKKVCKPILNSLESCIYRMDGIGKWFVVLEPDKIKYNM